MTPHLTLASASAARAAILNAAGLRVLQVPARVDEEAIRASLLAEQAKPHDIADALAEYKALKVAAKSDGLVLGADQVLSCQDRLISKASSKDELATQLRFLRDRQHSLHSAAVLYERGKPIWRHVAEAKLTMRNFSDSFLDGYLSRNWPDVSGCVGGYKIEGEGVRLFSRIDGDHFTILGLPLLPLLGYLAIRGIIDA